MCSEKLSRCVCGGEAFLERKNYLFFAVYKDCGSSAAAYPTETQAVRSWNKKIKRIKGGKS